MQNKKATFLFLIFCSANNFYIQADHNKNLPNIVFVTTGGTIASSTDPETGGVVPVLSGEDLIRVIPGLGALAHIEIVDFCNIDSSQMDPETRRKLSLFVDTILAKPNIKGVVITHGTDTIAETAHFLDVTLKSKKPVVLVGAMRDASAISPDGPENIYNATLQIVSPKTERFGVTVTMNEYIHAARDVNKASTTNIQAFSSGKKGCLGYIAAGKVYTYVNKLQNRKIPLADTLQKVILLKTFSGDDGKMIRYMVDSGAKGIVIESLGAGNVNKDVYNAIQYAIEHNVIVVLASSIMDESVHPIYGGPGGGVTLEKLGVIFAGDLSARKARISLMLAISKGLSYKEITQHFMY